MDNNLQVFTNEQFGEVRTLAIDNEPWFVGKDVAVVLGYEKPTDAVRKKVDDEDRGISKMETPSGTQEMTIINESGLYSLIFSSKLPAAKEFKRWVTSEVLPQIRKTGGYIPVSQEDDDLDIMIKANRIMQKTINLQNEKIAEYTPKVDMCDTFLLSKGCVSFQHWADSNTQGRNKLMRFLREHKILTKDGVNNIPYVRFVKNGYFKIDLTPCADGLIRPVTKITPKGAEYIFKICKKHNFCA